MPMPFPWILLFVVGVLAGLLLERAWRFARRRPLLEARALDAAPRPRLLGYDAPEATHGQATSTEDEVGAHGTEDVTEGSIEMAPVDDDTRVSRSFNAHALPGISYVGKLLEPKLAFLPSAHPSVNFHAHVTTDAIRLPVGMAGSTGRSEQKSGGTAYAWANGGGMDHAAMTVHSPVDLANGPANDSIEALVDYLRQHPDDLPLLKTTGRLLLDRASAEKDELERARLLDISIMYLDELAARSGSEAVPQALLGQAGYQRFLIGPSMDMALKLMAETALQRALDAGIAPEYGVALMLYELLTITLPGQNRETRVQQLNEARALVERELSREGDNAATWREARLRTELLLARYSHSNLTARRLHMRDLHAAYSESIQHETAPGVLAAWLELLCAMATPYAGSVAKSRYEEAADTLERLRWQDSAGRIHASALASFVLEGQNLRPRQPQLDLLVRAEATLLPHVEHDGKLRLLASRLALAHAQLIPATRASALYQQALAWARPLTSSPSLMLPALRVVLAALLATDESNDRRVYSRCLDVMVADDDVESLCLLAEVAFRDGRDIDGCRYGERAWRAGSAVSEAMLDAWQHGLDNWAAHARSGDGFTENRRRLRMARASKGMPRTTEAMA